MCRRYRQRPSQILQIDDPLIAIDFDLAVAAIHRYEDGSRLQSIAERDPMLALVVANTQS